MLTIRDIFDACNRKASQGLRVIGAHIGAPSHNPPLPIPEILKGMGDVGREYLPFTGMDETKESVVLFAQRFLKRDFDVNGVFITNGGAQSLLVSTLAIWQLRRGKIMIPAPGFTQYFENAESFSQPYVTYDPLAEDLIKEITGKLDGVSAVLINYPHNPTSHLPDNSVLRDLWDELRRRKVILINDAAYSQIYYKRRPEIVGDVIVDTFSKTFSIPGMRAGYIYWEGEGGDLVGRLIYQMTAGVSEVTQRVIVSMMEKASEDYFRGVREYYSRLRLMLLKEARRIGLEFPEPNGAFYLYARHPNVEDSEKLALKLLEGDPVVGIVPATAFRGGREWFRISYGRLSEESVAELIRVIDETVRGI